ncbi:uncharacterized protein LOC135098145 isoform X1 [Scylla paramamosain]|uniref:uncharacterized protein LOC135098145 isoform X1 n=1 Tax=Scylla paramamosain TaxID=85552 RepID=UPI003082F67B
MIPGQCASLCLHPHATMRSHLFVPLVNPFVPKPHGVYVVLQEPQPRVRDISAGRSRTKQREVFHAPFFTTRFCTAWTGLFCPLCLACLSCFRRDKDSLKVSLKTIAQNFRDRGVTFSYMHVYSLWIFDCTDVMALYSAHVSFVFLLSWVILHDQFVGVRVSRLTGREGVDGRLWYVMWSVLLLCCVWKLLVLVFSVSWSDCCWCIMS